MRGETRCKDGVGVGCQLANGCGILSGEGLLGDGFEDGAGHETTGGSTDARFADDDDAGVSGFVSREVATEGDLVSGGTVSGGRGYLGGAGFTGDGYEFGLGLYAGAILDDIDEHEVNGIEGRSGADGELDRLDGGGDEGVAVAGDVSGEARSYHTAVVGNGIEEGEDVQGGNAGFVAEGHPRERGARPVVLVGHTYLGFAGTGDLDIEVGSEPKLVESLDELLGVVFVAIEDDLGHADVGGVSDDLGGGDGAISTAVGVMVGHARTGVDEDTVAGVDEVVRLTDTVLEGDDHGGDFEGGSGFVLVGNGVVMCFGIESGGKSVEVGDGFDLTGGHIHDDGGARFGVNSLELVEEGFLGDVLDADVDGGVDVEAIEGFDFGDVSPGVADTSDGG